MTTWFCRSAFKINKFFSFISYGKKLYALVQALSCLNWKEIRPELAPYRLNSSPSCNVWRNTGVSSWICFPFQWPFTMDACLCPSIRLAINLSIFLMPFFFVLQWKTESWLIFVFLITSSWRLKGNENKKI